MADILARLAQKADSLSALQLTGTLWYSLSNTPTPPPRIHPYPHPPPPPPSPTFWTAPPPLTIQLFQSRLTLCIAEYRDGSELWVVLRAAACVNQVLNLFLRFQQSGVFRRYFHFYSLIELMWKLYCTINTCKYDSHFVLHSLCT